MASGVEIAGLVLAVLPLFISAVEHYKDGIGFVKRAIKKELFAARYKEELTQQRALLTLYIQGVIGRTNISAQTQAALVREPLGEAWRRPEVTKRLSDELAEAYQPFLDALLRIGKVLSGQIIRDAETPASDDDIVGFVGAPGNKANNKMQVKQLQGLCLENERVSSSETDKIKLLERIKFSWKSSQRAEILTEFRDCNRILEKLSVAADRAKPYIRKQRSHRVHAAYEHREVMQRLFNILCNACKCSQSEARHVGLQLTVRIDEGEGDRDSTFQMIMFLSQNVICEISAKIARAAAEPPPKKKVRILRSHSTDHNRTSSSSANMKLLDDICKEMVHAHACQSCLQLVVDKHEKVYCSAAGPSADPNPSTVRSLLSLTDVMSKLKHYDNKRWLHREKSILAVTLAYSLLQLHDGPWSQSQWNSDNITFLDKGHTTGSQSHLDVHLELRRPYTRSQVMAGMSPSSSNTTTTTTTTTTTQRPPRRNAHLHALGVVLVELYLNRSVQEDVLASNRGDYRAVAQDLLEDHADDMSMTPEYLHAARFCLSPAPDPSSGSFSFEDRGFRERYYDNVIAMLEENLTSRFEVNESVWLEGV